MEAEWALTGIRMRTISSLRCRYTYYAVQDPLLPWRWKQQIPPKSVYLSANYTASHPGRPVLLLNTVRTANLSVICRHVIKLIEMLRALKDAETRWQRARCRRVPQLGYEDDTALMHASCWATATFRVTYLKVRTRKRFVCKRYCAYCNVTMPFTRWSQVIWCSAQSFYGGYWLGLYRKLVESIRTSLEMCESSLFWDAGQQWLLVRYLGFGTA
jgi:hypothetical protein